MDFVGPGTGTRLRASVDRGSPRLTRVYREFINDPLKIRGMKNASPHRETKHMTAMNIVRLKIKQGQEQAYLDQHKPPHYPGLTRFNIVKTGHREYIVVGEWESVEAMAAARPAMIETLNGFRDKLDYLGDGFHVTDPHSGEVVVSA